MSLEDLLYGAMLPSGNDAAFAIAETVGAMMQIESRTNFKYIVYDQHDLKHALSKIKGGLNYFLVQMNKKAKDLGLTNTKYDNPHGNAPSQNYSSALD